MDQPSWRPMRSDDLAAVQVISDAVHPGFFEAPAVLAEKYRLYPAGCFVLQSGGDLLGYVFTHPWRTGELPALNRLLGRLPDDAGSFYVHDLALLPGARGTGAAGAIVARLADYAVAAGFAEMSLVAVNGSAAFWNRQGFVVVDAPELAAKLAGYEPTARLMRRRLV